MCEKGYHNVDCIQIAKAAGVSTGTVYQYFKDKKDIFLQGFEHNTKETLFPVIEFKNQKVQGNITHEIVEQLIDATVKKHYFNQKPHREIASMIHADYDVAQIFKQFEEEAINTLIEIMQNSQIQLPNLPERAHLILNMVDDYCHELLFHKHKGLDMSAMKELTIEGILLLLDKKL